MIKNARKPLKIKHIAHQVLTGMDRWYETPLGSFIGQRVRHALEDFMSTSFGYYTISVGVNPRVCGLLDHCRTRHQFHFGYPEQAPSAVSEPEVLPIANDSIDVVVLNHALSLSVDPHAMLREVNRVLIPDGKLVIIDFNPASLWGLRHLLQGWLDKVPWGGQYYTAHRIKDWATLLGFELQAEACQGFVLPFEVSRLINRMSVFEKFSQRWLGFSGAVNILVFEKNTIPLTPYRPRWVGQKILPPKVIRPAAGRGMRYQR
jgi:SAM-dependent methyltransferase